MKKITIWKASDRRGSHYFEACPTYNSGFDTFDGADRKYSEKGLPKNRKSYRLLTKFKVKVVGAFVGKYGYPNEFVVGY